MEGSKSPESCCLCGQGKLTKATRRVIIHFFNAGKRIGFLLSSSM
jgi:hypothetical protein